MLMLFALPTLVVGMMQQPYQPHYSAAGMGLGPGMLMFPMGGGMMDQPGQPSAQRGHQVAHPAGSFGMLPMAGPPMNPMMTAMLLNGYTGPNGAPPFGGGGMQMGPGSGRPRMGPPGGLIQNALPAPGWPSHGGGGMGGLSPMGGLGGFGGSPYGMGTQLNGLYGQYGTMPGSINANSMMGQAFHMADGDRNGSISKDEFRKFFGGTPAASGQATGLSDAAIGAARFKESDRNSVNKPIEMSSDKTPSKSAQTLRTSQIRLRKAEEAVRALESRLKDSTHHM